MLHIASDSDAAYRCDRLKLTTTLRVTLRVEKAEKGREEQRKAEDAPIFTLICFLLHLSALRCP
jgi:hypothetical protein